MSRDGGIGFDERREANWRKALAEQGREDWRCPECGGEPASFLMERHRVAPVGASSWEVAVTCVNGHAEALCRGDYMRPIDRKGK